MEKEFIDFNLKLKSYRAELLKKRKFMAEHGFWHEQNYIQQKLDVSEQIMWAIDDVLSKNKKGNQVNFNF